MVRLPDVKARASSPAGPLLAASLIVAAVVGGCDKTQPPPSADAGGATSPSSASSAATAPSAAIATVAWAPKDKEAALSAGRAVLEKNQCTRCHTIDDLPAAARPLACASCHVFLKGLKPEDRQRKAMVEKYGEEIIGRYQRNIDHLQDVPSLTKIARRVRPSFLAAYLREPFDLRPAMEESMIRHRLSEDDIRAVVRYFAARADAADPFAPGHVETPHAAKPSDARLAEGKKLFLGRGCATCHTFGNVATGVTAKSFEGGGMAARLAPNLRFVKDRTRPDALVPWIVDPQGVSPGTLMPPMGVSAADAQAIADYLVHGDPELAKAPAIAEPPPPKLLDRPVPYEEMKEAVLGKICVHCHMNDHEKDPGPGNRGGLGYAGIQLQMRTYETLVAGAVDEKGKRYSVLEKRPGETTPRIISAMLDRRVEELRDRVAPFADHERPPYPKRLPGMPLGLPSMSDEQISILATWIAQGCPGPTKVTGKEGVDDGYLVPDGPIKKNKGCELRAPEAKRPAWAVDAKPASSAKTP